MLGDHVILPQPGAPPPVAQVIEAQARLAATAVIGTAVTPAERAGSFGALAGRPLAPSIAAGQRLYRITRAVEKPSPDVARRELQTPGLPDGHVLTHFGLYAFSPAIFEALDHLVRNDIREGGEVQLTTAEQMLIEQHDDACALHIIGRALDVGTPGGLAEAQGVLSCRRAEGADGRASGEPEMRR